MPKHILILLVICIVCTSHIFPQETFPIDSSDFNKDSPIITLSKFWKYHSGDNKAWASADYNDSTWLKGDTQKTPSSQNKKEWTGIGWFRIKFNVDSSLWNSTIGLRIIQNGASEIYLNGKLVHTVGRVGKTAQEELIKREINYPTPISFDSKKIQVLAVRYSNLSNEEQEAMDSKNGFTVQIGNLENYINIRTEQESASLLKVMIFGAIPFIFTIIHLSIFFFYREDISNLYFGLITLGISTISFLQYRFSLLDDPNTALNLGLIFLFAFVIIIISLLLFTYQNFSENIPKHFILFVIAGIVLYSIVIISRSYRAFNYFNYFAGLAILDIFRVLTLSIIKRKFRINFLTVGFLIFIKLLLFQIILEFWNINLHMSIPPYLIGVMLWLVFMSIHLSQNFGRINKELKIEIARVRELSLQRIETERREKERELSQMLLEADNERKTKELEDARKLQISMLPKEIPDLPYLQIAASMSTSTEVGGDYYDFHVTSDNELILAIGDATGHGSRAGNLVSATKSLFSSLRDGAQPLELITTYDAAFKKMNLPSLYMALLVAKIEKNKIIFSNAGMPPVFLFKDKKAETIQLLQKSLPLGGPATFPYKEDEVELSIGDVLLFASDGLYEFFNPDNELLGLKKARSFFEMFVKLPPGEIIEGIKSELDKWSGGSVQRDDITLITVKLV